MNGSGEFDYSRVSFVKNTGNIHQRNSGERYFRKYARILEIMSFKLQVIEIGGFSIERKTDL